MAKLPIVVQYGAESEWDEEEKLRVLADRDVFDEEFEEGDNKEEERETNLDDKEKKGQETNTEI